MNFLEKNKLKTSRIAILIIFLALIRCLSEFFRLEFLHADSLTILQVKPFIMGSLIASIALFVMVILYFFARYKWIAPLGLIAIAVLLVVKFTYGLS